MSGGEDGGRTFAEWVTFAVSVAILLALVAVIGVQITKTDSPPAPVAITGQVDERGGRFVVPVTVENQGDATVENVQVLASLTIDGETQEADQTIDFLSGGETEEVEFVFADDPADGDLEVTIGGYLVP